MKLSAGASLYVPRRYSAEAQLECLDANATSLFTWGQIKVATSISRHENVTAFWLIRAASELGRAGVHTLRGVLLSYGESKPALASVRNQTQSSSTTVDVKQNSDTAKAVEKESGV